MPWWIQDTPSDSASSSSRNGRAASKVPVRTQRERAEFAAHWALVGIELRPGDHNYLCPFHPDHHPSLHIDAEGCRFYCFGCGRGGGNGRLRHLLEAPRRPAPSRDRGGADRLVHRTRTPVTLPGATEVRVVGESAYQDALLELTGGWRHYGGVRMEEGGPPCSGAGQPRGSRGDRREYRGTHRGVPAAPRRKAPPPADRAHASNHSGEASCMALIVGGWRNEHVISGCSACASISAFRTNEFDNAIVVVHEILRRM